MAGKRVLSPSHMCHSLFQKAAKNLLSLENWTIDDLKLSIELQQNLLSQEEEGLKRVETVVQNAVQEELKFDKTMTIKTETKSNASALTRTCSAGFEHSSGNRREAHFEKLLPNRRYSPL